METSLQIMLIPLLPLISFVILGLLARRLPTWLAGWLATAIMTAAFALSVSVTYDFFHAPQQVGGVLASMTWLDFGNGLSIQWGLWLDSLSAIMLVVVTLVSLLVHLYSLCYLLGEKRFVTYFAYLGLFSASMLGLVLASNLFQLYICWELVGVSSFLLIGFYYERPAAVAAAKKAFIVTRFADFGFLIGILILSSYAGTLDFIPMLSELGNSQSPVFASAAGASFLGVSALAWGVGLVFVGGAGKSALFPLHVWLPDAMEGPTPVSALIHAATMVVAGVFLVARMFPVFFQVPVLMDLITWVGIISALSAAIVACTQTDIKRVLAYSTLSQIGFMIVALGVSGMTGESGLGYTASIFHLTTHAAFKALLFLGAGVVIHYVHSNEMRDMGSLRKQMPVTHLMFLIACLAIAGLPPFAGFYSKEAILLAVYQKAPVVFYLALFTSFLTAFYMFRLYFRIFWNQPAPHEHHGKEGGVLLLLPLIVLGVLSVSTGWLPFGNLVHPTSTPIALELHLGFSVAPVMAAVLGIGIAAWWYMRPTDKPATAAARLGTVYQAAHAKWYVDELYRWVVRHVFYGTIGRIAAWFDRQVIDAAVQGFGQGWIRVSQEIKSLQSGKVQWYGWFFVVGMLLLATALIVMTNAGIIH